MAAVTSVGHLDQSADDAEAGQPQVLKRPRLAGRVEEGVQEERDVRCGQANEEVSKESAPDLYMQTRKWTHRVGECDTSQWVTGPCHGQLEGMQAA